MKVRVLKAFIDKEAKVRRRTGDTFDCDDKRYKEITEAGRYIEAVTDDKNGEPQKDDGDVNTDAKRLEGMSAAELREYADNRFKLAFPENTKKAEMIAAILEREKG